MWCIIEQNDQLYIVCDVIVAVKNCKISMHIIVRMYSKLSVRFFVKIYKWISCSYCECNFISFLCRGFRVAFV